jgi:hypothetical protein
LSPVGGMWCMMTAKDFVPVGASFQAIGGEILAPSQVYFAGKVPLLVKAELSAVSVLVTTSASTVSVLQENRKLMSSKGNILNICMRLVCFIVKVFDKKTARL